MKIFFSFEKKETRNLRTCGPFLTSSSNHSKFGYRVYSIKRMCDYFFWWGTLWLLLLLLLMLRFRVVVEIAKRGVHRDSKNFCTPPPPSPPEFIIHAVYPATINQKTGTEKYDIILSCPRPPLLLFFFFFLFSLFLSTCLCFLSTKSFTYHIPFWNPCQKVKL